MSTVTKPSLTLARNVRSWGDYCRHNGLKNRGSGRASIIGERYTIRGEVQLLPDGTVQGLPDDISQPSDLIQTQLRDAYEAIITQRLPEPSASVKIHGLPPNTDMPGVKTRTHFLYPAEDPDHASMIVERLDFDNPDEHPKRCIPWLFFGDTQEWESEVPTGYDKPLYGQVFGGYRYMVHEGEKACDAAIAASRPGSNHPWQSFLSQFQHISWQGGAFPGAVEYTDWSIINRSDVIVYLMPDNDEDGYKVARRIRKILRRVKGLYCVHWKDFDQLFPKKWDIADPVPLNLKGQPVPETTIEGSFTIWEEAGQWVKVKQDNGKEKLEYKIREEFAKKFSYIVKTEEWSEMNRPWIRYTSKGLNMWGLPLSEGIVPNLANAIRATGHTHTHDRSGYKPGGTIVNGQWIRPPRSWREKGESVLNLYTQTEVEELAPRARIGAVNPELAKEQGKRPWRDTEQTSRPFLLYLRHLIPDAVQRKILIRWACNNLTSVEPDDRVPWAVLLYSAEQGTGKTTLGRVLSALVGSANSMAVNGMNLNDEFTGWMEGKQLISIEELKEDSGFKLYDRLKEYISNPEVSVRRMYAVPYSVESHLTLLAMSNHMSAISIPNSDEDRRWFFPSVTSKIAPDERIHHMIRVYMKGDANHFGLFSGLWRWLKQRNGMRYLLWWMRRYGWSLHTQPRDWTYRGGKPVLFREAYNRAPLTALKKKISTRSTPDWEDRLDAAIDPSDNQILVLEDVVAYLEEELKRGIPRSAVIKEWLEKHGYVPSYGSEKKRIDLFQGGGLPAPIRGHALFYREYRPRMHWVDDRTDLKWLSDKFRLKMDGWAPASSGQRAASKKDEVVEDKSTSQKIADGDIPF